MKEETKSAVALAHSRECTKELISGLPNFGSMETFGARQKNEMSSGKKAADVLPLALLSGLFFVFCGQRNTGAIYFAMFTNTIWSYLLRPPVIGTVCTVDHGSGPL